MFSIESKAGSLENCFDILGAVVLLVLTETVPSDNQKSDRGKDHKPSNNPTSYRGAIDFGVAVCLRCGCCYNRGRRCGDNPGLILSCPICTDHVVHEGL